MCCSGPKWKREVVPDHKFDFVDTREFTDKGFFMKLKYLWLYLIVLKSFLVYVTDIFTAVTMLTTNSWSNQIFNDCAAQEIDGCIAIPFNTGKWLFVGCIIFSFLLLAYEARKAKKIIASRDISYAFTNVMANNYYSLRSYDHFCFFDHISNSTKLSDDFAFFVFFTFKSWKRVLLADGPRQTINALTLYAIYLSKKDQGHWYDIGKYFDSRKLATSAITVSTTFTVVVFLGSLFLLIIAGVCYLPLLCHIRGNLKEYCCHKVDKRINTIIKRRQKQRLNEAAKLAQKEARGDYSHLKNKKGEFIAQPLPQPTLPNLSVDDDDDYSSMHTRVPPASTAASTYTYGQDQYYYNSDKHDYPPPMPAYNPYSTEQPPGAYAHFNQSQGNIPYEDSLYNYPPPQQQMYDEDNESQVHLASGAAPFAHHMSYQSQYSDRSGTPSNAPSQASPLSYDPHDVYQGRVDAAPTRSPPPANSSTYSRSPVGLAYDQPSPSPSSPSPGATLYSTPSHSDPYGYHSSTYLNASQQQQQYPQRSRSPYDDGGHGHGHAGGGYAA